MSNTRVNNQDLINLTRDNDQKKEDQTKTKKQDTSKKPAKAPQKKKTTPLFPIVDIINDCVLKRTGKQLIKGKRYSLRWDDIKELKKADYKYVNTI